MISRVFLLFIFLLSLGFSEDIPKEIDNIDNSFITKFEYGKMLYNNPRGIGCIKCHGKDANGKSLGKFEHIYKKKKYKCEMKIPSIKDVSYEVFSEKINQKKNPNKKFPKDEVCEKTIYYANIMPTYFLVEDEIKAIYYYIQNLK